MTKNESAWTRYGVLLTYADRLSNFDPSAYEKYFKDADKSKLTEIEKQYKQYGMKHLKALMESIKRHSNTRLGQDWEGYFKAYLSCCKGFLGFKELHITNEGSSILRAKRDEPFEDADSGEDLGL